MDGWAMDRETDGNHARFVTPFGRLIHELRTRRGLSLRQLADLSAARGYKVSHTRIGDLETKPIPTWPSADIIKGLAAALGVPERVLTAALVESMGLTLPQMPSTDWLMVISKAEQMTPAGQRRLMRQIDTLFDVNDEAE